MKRDKRYRSVRMGAATIAHGNGKVGSVPNVSLLPIVSCPPNVPCAKRGECYANRDCKRFPTVDAAWRRNWVASRKQRDEYFQGVRDYLSKYAPRYFRWHVGGDIPDQDYLNRMRQLAREFPKTNFLAFTKAHELDYRRLPGNLNIVFSLWPGWGNSRKRMPRAWMQDGTEKRIPDSAIQCSGQCDACGICWHLRAGHDVWFAKH